MAKIVLGLDIGGANLKAATSAGRAKSVPFAVWKQPENLGAAIKDLVAQFPEASELAATMTAELCDCYKTKREGVAAIVDALSAVNEDVRIWSTGSEFLSADEAKANHLKVAAANWHALATFAGRFVKDDDALLVDIGTTTTDIIPLECGIVKAAFDTDPQRLMMKELIYQGWRRTPATTLLGPEYASEFFATAHDAYLVLGLVKEDEADRDTADGRPATRHYAQARLSRMLCGDLETISPERIQEIAEIIHQRQAKIIQNAIHESITLNLTRTIILSGSGTFIIREAFASWPQIVDLNAILGSELSACAPAYAIAVLAAESPPRSAAQSLLVAANR